ncbi:hypothetical protein FRC07_010682, partial [Ceratobasidium sp. 392]
EKEDHTESTKPVQGGSLSREDIRDRLSKCPPKNFAKALLEAVKTATSSELRASSRPVSPRSTSRERKRPASLRTLP